VSTHTGRCRTIESSYLNQLARTGWLTKRRNSKNLFFYPISRKILTKRNREDEIPLPQPAKLNYNLERENRKDQVASKTIRVEHLSTDYDGTISPIQVARCESHVPLETRVLLSQISRSLPISIITMKDLHFITSRTPFAHAWSAIGGLETQIGKRVLKNEFVDSKLPMISKALEYAKTQANAAGIEIEEKQDSEGQTIAFCVDWRRTKNRDMAKQVADRIIDYCDALGLQVLKYESQPFCDVYPISPDKGKALQEMLSQIAVKKGVMYLGDSETDNAVFKNSIVSVSIGVIHDESQLRNLECDYLLKFEDVPDFFKTLIMKNFQFSSSFPMIKTNPHRRISP
jgi:trehalose-phosphatase